MFQEGQEWDKWINATGRTCDKLLCTMVPHLFPLLWWRKFYPSGQMEPRSHFHLHICSLICSFITLAVLTCLLRMYDCFASGLRAPCNPLHCSGPAWQSRMSSEPGQRGSSSYLDPAIYHSGSQLPYLRKWGWRCCSINLVTTEILKLEKSVFVPPVTTRTSK